MKLPKQRFVFALWITFFVIMAGCAESIGNDSSTNDDTTQASSDESKAPAVAPKENAKAGMDKKKMNFPAAKDMKFKDEIESNATTPKNVADLTFTGKDGNLIKLNDFIGKKNIVLVFTEGFDGMLCPFCKAQTSRLVANYDRFKERDCEVIVVYPGPADHLEEFIEAATTTEKDQVDQVPFPIVLDEEFKATNFFDIHSKHAHPSTYIIDKNGGVQFAYVGQDMSADRPSISAIIRKLDKIQGE